MPCYMFEGHLIRGLPIEALILSICFYVSVVHFVERALAMVGELWLFACGLEDFLPFPYKAFGMRKFIKILHYLFAM